MKVVGAIGAAMLCVAVLQGLMILMLFLPNIGGEAYSVGVADGSISGGNYWESLQTSPNTPVPKDMSAPPRGRHGG